MQAASRNWEGKKIPSYSLQRSVGLQTVVSETLSVWQSVPAATGNRRTGLRLSACEQVRSLARWAVRTASPQVCESRPAGAGVVMTDSVDFLWES